jgi:hypothetical protein
MAGVAEAQGGEAPESRPAIGEASDCPAPRISEDWAATILGLVLLLLALLGVIGKGVVP